MTAKGLPSLTGNVPSEIWDDDFDFQRNAERNMTSRSNNSASTDGRVSMTSDDWNSQDNHDMDQTTSFHHEKRNIFPPAVGLSNWAEARADASTPTKGYGPPPQENWDDDFEDSPGRRSTRRGTPRKPTRVRHVESWDDDFEDPGPSRPSSSPTSKRTRRDAYPDSSDEEECVTGLSERDEEDRTVTARSRRAQLRGSPPPPVPALPPVFATLMLASNAPEPFPQSPSGSVFSIPTTTGRESVTYSSSSHLALRQTGSGTSKSLAGLPPSPPIHRERRRLRKKSRPPNFEGQGIFELKDEEEDVPSVPRPASPERPVTPTRDGAGITSTSPNSRTPLLSRIGSVKRWGARKKRASTGPSEMIAREAESIRETTPRPASSLATSPPTPARGSWFFRPHPSGSPPSAFKAELNRETSLDRLHVFIETGDLSSQNGNDVGRAPSASNGHPVPDRTIRTFSSKTSLNPEIRLPMSVHAARKPVGSRHTSYSGHSVGRSTTPISVSASAEDLTRTSTPELPPEGSRSLMGSIRRISLVGAQKRHKRPKSATEVVSPPPQSSPPDESKMTSKELPLLPPIELQPPSILLSNDGSMASQMHVLGDSTNVAVLQTSLSDPLGLSERHSPVNRALLGRSSMKSPAPPQSASLGRTIQAPIADDQANEKVIRRNSLGDLKIPVRISQAQVGLKRDLGLVREFAASIEQLKVLQALYLRLVSEIRDIMDSAPSQPTSRATSPTFFNISRPASRIRSNTNPVPPSRSYKAFSVAFRAIETKYLVSWECAELLIELGSGTHATPATSAIAVQEHPSSAENRKSRERAITLSGDESIPPPMASHDNVLVSPPSLAWRASTGRHDLSSRQLMLLREMMHSSDAEFNPETLIIEEETANRQWRWGDAMNSTVTFSSEYSVQESPKKTRRQSRMGMSGIRDMLRALKKGNMEKPISGLIPPSTDRPSEKDSQHIPPVVSRRRAKTSTGPESIRSTKDEQLPSATSHNGSFVHRPSPRRPSLASIFRFSQKQKTTNAINVSTDSIDNTRSGSRQSAYGDNVTTEEDDWDHVDSASDLGFSPQADGMGDGSSTVKGKKGRSPYLTERQRHIRPSTPQGTSSGSQLSICGNSSLQTQNTNAVPPGRLSNVEETLDDRPRPSRSLSQSRTITSATPLGQGRPNARQTTLKSGSVRSAPSRSPGSINQSKLLNAGKLAMTPENIRPLLENAKEVHVKLNQCIREVKVLLSARP